MPQGGKAMEKRKEAHKQILKDIEAFRTRQKLAIPSDDDLKKREFRELQEILSPFWAWRLH
jgi:hypothetical protein